MQPLGRGLTLSIRKYCTLTPTLAKYLGSHGASDTHNTNYARPYGLLINITIIHLFSTAEYLLPPWSQPLRRPHFEAPTVAPTHRLVCDGSS